MSTNRKALWIDVDNSPHVPLFAPIIRHYRQSGIQVVLTARSHSQTLELLDLHGFAGTYQVIGRHHGASRAAKIAGTLSRARELSQHIRKVADVGVALSHGSRAMALGAWRRRIPVLTMYDYEHTETSIFNRFSTRVIVPELLSEDVLDQIGLARQKRRSYPGIKEELYIRTFEPDPLFRHDLLVKLGIKATIGLTLVVLRPPATTANYHSPASEELFDRLIDHLAAAEQVFTIIVPRTAQQAAGISARLEHMNGAHNLRVLSTAVDGLQLAHASDLLISGGGTMNREAALLGVPVYSIFAGKLGSLDAAMEKDGTIRFIRSSEDVPKIALVPRKRGGTPCHALTDRVENFVIGQIDEFLC